MVPVSIRTGDEEEPWTNRVSGPRRRPADAHARPAGARSARAARRWTGPSASSSWCRPRRSSTSSSTRRPSWPPSAIRLAGRLKLADRMDPPVNVIISNVPGPRQPLYLDGARMTTYIPVSTIGEGMGLNITVHSYLDELEFGLIACRELVPDLWHMVDLHIAEIDVLFAAAGLAREETPAPAAAAQAAAPDRAEARRRPRRGTSRRAAEGRAGGRRGTRKAAPAAARRTGKAAPAKAAPALRRRPPRRRRRRPPTRSSGRRRQAAAARRLASAAASRPAPASRRTPAGPPWRPRT